MTAPATLAASVTSPASAVRVIVMESDAAPAELGGTIAKILAGTISDSGDVALSVSLAESSAGSAILLASGGAPRVLLRAGDAAPGGGRYKAFSDLDLALLSIESARKPILLFRAELAGGPASEGIFLWQPEDVEVVALAGQPSPRGHTYKSFSHLSIISAHPILVLSKLAFVATMEDGKKSVMLKNSSDTLYENLTTGDVIGPRANEVVNDFTISRLGFSLSCIVQVHRKGNKKVRYRKVITIDGFLAVGNALKEGVRYPVLGKVKRIFEPPAMHFQQGYAAIAFKSGVSALATRDIDGASEVFAKTGDTTADVPGETIESFGPPISSSFRLRTFDETGEISGPAGIISPVRLSGGRMALWLRVFTHAVPRLDGTVRLLLIGGSATLDGQELTLRSFTPVKLSNRGALLLRGTVGEGDTARDGLFVMDGLFDEQ
ncbi:MAG TPA: hypothetical protein VNO70_12740 [Blastocatellia bacterium]|nr:hypothetical protein [Blastocatellia bacterium]